MQIKLVSFEISINQNFAFAPFDGNEAVRRIKGVRAARNARVAGGLRLLMCVRF